MILFIRRPVMTTLVMTGILVFGILGYRLLPVSDLPNVDFPTISVSASLPGASPETMASAVATPLEKQFSTIAGIDNMTSTSGQGATSITLQFNLGRDIDAAAQDVQAAISAAQRQLPRDMPSPPSYQKSNPADDPILFIAFTSPTLPLSQLNEYGEILLAQRISMLPGVAQVQIYGAQKRAVRIQLDPQAMASRGVGIDQVIAAVQESNVNLPTGTLWGPEKAITVQATGQLNTADEYRPIVVAYRDGAPVRLGDLGRVLESVQNNKVASWYRDTRAVVMVVQRQPGTNTVEVAESVRALIPLVKAKLPASVDLNVIFDRSESIKRSVRDVKFTLLLTLCLVVLVIALFLRNLPATVIPSLALPLSVVGTFAVMSLLGFNLDNLSLMALTLAVGFVVDDAIVMLENIVRHVEMGKPGLQAAVDGAGEIGFTIVSMTVSLTAVFIPLLFMGGLVGRLFREFAVTISVAILVSGFVSLSLTPMLCSRFLRPEHGTRHGRLYGLLEAGHLWSLGRYERTLAWVMRHKRGTVIFSLAVLVLTVYLAVTIPKGFLPSEDTGQIRGSTEAAEGISFEAMVRHQKEVASIILSDPNVEGFMSSVSSGGGVSSTNVGRLFLRLKPRAQRRLSAEEVIQALRPRLAQVPGLRTFLVLPPPVNLGGRISSSLYQFTLQAPDLKELYASASRLDARLRQIPELLDVTSDLKISNPEVNLVLDRDRAASLGVSPQRIEEALYSAYGSRPISTILAPNNQYYVLLELLPEFQRDPSALALLSVRSATGNLVPLSALAQVRRDIGPLAIAHQGQLPAVTLSFNLKPGVALSQAVALVQAAARETLPPTVTATFAGTAQAFQSSQGGLLALLVLAILVIYMILGILYESFVHPLTILSGLPFAGFGALVTLLLFRVDLNVYSFVGVIMLVGVVKKNAIMMIDFALEAQRRKGRTAEEAILEACSIRFRPIMMTTMAALMGTLPIALGFGTGAESRRPLGLAVVGGLAFSQVVTLYVTPVFYCYLDRFQRSLSGRFRLFSPQGAGGA